MAAAGDAGDCGSRHGGLLLVESGVALAGKVGVGAVPDRVHQLLGGFELRHVPGSWKLSVKTWSMVREKKSAIGWPGTSMPTASTRMAPLTRGEASRAISAAIHPPTEFPMTVTSSSFKLAEQRHVQRGQARDAG